MKFTLYPTLKERLEGCGGLKKSGCIPVLYIRLHVFPPI